MSWVVGTAASLLHRELASRGAESHARLVVATIIEGEVWHLTLSTSESDDELAKQLAEAEASAAALEKELEAARMVIRMLEDTLEGERERMGEVLDDLSSDN